MPHLALAALEGILRPHVALGKSRLETLCLLIVGMVSARTVNLAHIACERPGPAQTASTYRRLQRFFQHVRLEPGMPMKLIVGTFTAKPDRRSDHLAAARDHLERSRLDPDCLYIELVPMPDHPDNVAQAPFHLTFTFFINIFRNILHATVPRAHQRPLPLFRVFDDPARIA